MLGYLRTAPAGSHACTWRRQVSLLTPAGAFLIREDRSVYLWLDYETSGLDEQTGIILEAACVLTDDSLNEVARTEALIACPPGYADPQEWVDPFVLKMHTESGLWAARAIAGDHMTTIGQFDELICRRLMSNTADRYTMAGTGVGHFDLRWCKVHMPLTAGFLSYWTMDVGNVRRFLHDICGIQRSDDVGPVAHRAMSDVEQSLAFARTWRDQFVALSHMLPGDGYQGSTFEQDVAALTPAQRAIVFGGAVLPSFDSTEEQGK